MLAVVDFFFPVVEEEYDERESFQEVESQHAVLRQLFRFLPRRMQQKKLIAFVTEETVDRLSVFLLNLF